jgi:hypothetical protein
MSGFIFFGRSLRSGYPLYLLLHYLYIDPTLFKQKDAATTPNAISSSTYRFIIISHFYIYDAIQKNHPK